MRVGADQVPQPAKASRLVLVIMAVVFAALRTVVMRPVKVVAALMLMLMAVVMTMARAVRLAHGFILRDEMRFRTSTITRTAHLRSERNTPPSKPLHDNSKKRW